MPKYQVTGWSPTAMYAMVEIEAANAKEATEKGHDVLIKVGDFEYTDGHPVTINGLDCVRAESDEATDTYEWNDPDHAAIRAAARAMLAALQQLSAWHTMLGNAPDSGAMQEARAAIAEAESAGITSEE